MSSIAIPTDYIDEWLERLGRSDEKAQRLAGPLDREQLNWRPAPEAWGVGHCLEHVRAGAEIYFDTLDRCIERGRARGMTVRDGSRPRHTLMGRELIKAVSPDMKRKMKAPGKIAPVPDAPDDALARFLEAQRRVAEFIRAARGLNLEKVKMNSPVLWIVRLNLADAFEVLVAHPERHLNQAEAVTKQAGFPRPA